MSAAPEPTPHAGASGPLPRLWQQGAISLIGMAGAGKSTLGRMLAEKLGWAHVDTDRLIESYYGLPLQDVLDGLGLEEFLKVENSLVAMLNVRRAVISTGGSVVYGREAMERLHLLGPVVHLDISLQSFLKRVGDGSNRGLAIAPGRRPDFGCDSGGGEGLKRHAPASRWSAANISVSCAYGAPSSLMRP